MKFPYVDAACDTARLRLQAWDAELEPRVLAAAGGGGLIGRRARGSVRSKTHSATRPQPDIHRTAPRPRAAV